MSFERNEASKQVGLILQDDNREKSAISGPSATAAGPSGGLHSSVPSMASSKRTNDRSDRISALKRREKMQPYLEQMSAQMEQN
jgi:hypothetical protein